MWHYSQVYIYIYWWKWSNLGHTSILLPICNITYRKKIFSSMSVTIKDLLTRWKRKYMNMMHKRLRAHDRDRLEIVPRVGCRGRYCATFSSFSMHQYIMLWVKVVVELMRWLILRLTKRKLLSIMDRCKLFLWHLVPRSDIHAGNTTHHIFTWDQNMTIAWLGLASYMCKMNYEN